MICNHIHVRVNLSTFFNFHLGFRFQNCQVISLKTHFEFDVGVRFVYCTVRQILEVYLCKTECE